MVKRVLFLIIVKSQSGDDIYNISNSFPQIEKENKLTEAFT